MLLPISRATGTIASAASRNMAGAPTPGRARAAIAIGTNTSIQCCDHLPACFDMDVPRLEEQPMRCGWALDDRAQPAKAAAAGQRKSGNNGRLHCRSGVNDRRTCCSGPRPLHHPVVLPGRARISRDRLARAHGRKCRPAGWLKTEIPVESFEQSARQLLQLGAEIEVLSPTALRSAVAREAAAVSARYARRQPAG